MKEDEQHRKQAWTRFWTNLLVLPGLGSVLAGRRVGYLQMAVTLTGCGLCAWFIWATTRQWVVEGMVTSPGFAVLGAGVGGLGLIGVGWLWSLVTSLAILREARRAGERR